MAQCSLLHVDMFVWIDETGSDARNHIQKCGYALRGETPVCHRLLGRGQRTNATAANWQRNVPIPSLDLRFELHIQYILYAPGRPVITPRRNPGHAVFNAIEIHCMRNQISPRVPRYARNMTSRF